MKKMLIDLTYAPTGGSLAQIKEIINNIESYKFEMIVFYITRENYHLFQRVNNNKIKILFVPFSNSSIILRTIWAQFILPFYLLNNKIDLLFCPGNISPIINSTKKVQWIGTVGPFEKKFISFFGLRQRIVLFITKYLMIFSSYTSDLVIFESEYTQELFVERYGQKKERSTVICIGNDDFFYNTLGESSENYHQYGKFILVVAHLYPYKNIEILLESYYDSNLHLRGLKIVIAGTIINENYYKKLIAKIEDFGLIEYVIFLGSVHKHMLRDLYSHCTMLVFTSPFENFAYTLVEAMSCAAPIIATNTTAMPETCGDAVLYFSPDSHKELSLCILKYLDNNELRKEYKERARIKSMTYDTYSEVNNITANLLSQINTNK
jgi:glycosyltransferase involved in cell wall biosynthesis